MYELQDLNQNIIQNFYELLAKNLKENNIIPIIKAVEFAVKGKGDSPPFPSFYGKNQL
jgi:hypothetical protein